MMKRKIGFGLAAFLLLAGLASGAGIKLFNSADIDLNGGDLKDGGTTIWDSSAGNSDVLVDESGDEISGNLNISESKAKLDLQSTGGDDSLIESSTTGDLDIADVDAISRGSAGIDTGGSDSDLEILSGGSIELEADADTSTTTDVDILTPQSGEEITLDGDSSTTNDCGIDDGTLSCNSKNFVQKINKTHSVYYTSQEGPMPRAVYEGQTDVKSGRVNLTLPSHFSKVVSDQKPMLRVQATPHELATVAVTARDDSWLVIKADTTEEITVDYRITGIREGYEDKDVVRKR